jgi:hypothetical protein
MLSDGTGLDVPTHQDEKAGFRNAQCLQQEAFLPGWLKII